MRRCIIGISFGAIGALSLLGPSAARGAEPVRADLSELMAYGCPFGDSWLDTTTYVWDEPRLRVADREWKIKGKAGRQSLASLVHGCMPDSKADRASTDAEGEAPQLDPALGGGALVSWLSARHEHLVAWQQQRAADQTTCVRTLDKVPTSELSTVIAACGQLADEANEVQLADSALLGAPRTVTLAREALKTGRAGARAAEAERDARASAAETFRTAEASLRAECVGMPADLAALTSRQGACDRWDALVAAKPRDGVVEADAAAAVKHARGDESRLQVDLTAARDAAAHAALRACTTANPADEAALQVALKACDAADSFAAGGVFAASEATSVGLARARLGLAATGFVIRLASTVPLRELVDMEQVVKFSDVTYVAIVYRLQAVASQRDLTGAAAFDKMIMASLEAFASLPPPASGDMAPKEVGARIMPFDDAPLKALFDTHMPWATRIPGMRAAVGRGWERGYRAAVDAAHSAGRSICLTYLGHPKDTSGERAGLALALAGGMTAEVNKTLDACFVGYAPSAVTPGWVGATAVPLDMAWKARARATELARIRTVLADDIAGMNILLRATARGQAQTASQNASCSKGFVVKYEWTCDASGATYWSERVPNSTCGRRMSDRWKKTGNGGCKPQ